MGRAWLVLADMVLGLHVAFAAFIVLGLCLICLGPLLDVRLARNRAFRLCHLGAIGIVTLESLAGLACPLTELEDLLRRLAGAVEVSSQGFVARWLGGVLYYDLPEHLFAVAYLVVLLATLGAWRLVPPTGPGARRGRSAAGGC